MKINAIGLLGLMALGSPAARAQPAPVPAVADPASDQAADETDADAAPQWISLQDLQERLLRTEEMTLNRAPTLQWSGYIDAGFFAPQGDGAGYVQDFGHVRHPNERFGWVFLGDILAPTVNSRGEAADLGEAPGVERYDGIQSRGAPGFILNETNLSLRAAIRPTAIATASLNITPRTGNNFHLGDLLDLDLAQVEWLPTESQKTSIFVGKIESVIGIEYRDRKANRRFGITPSLIARYTTEPALGIKVRSKFGPDDLVVVAAALTNGSNTSERFHYYNETDSNAGKTASGRVSVRLPVPGNLEIGASGSYGSQDRALTSEGIMWFVGPDLLARFGSVDVKAQWLTGKAPGSAIDQVYGLHLKGGGYLEINWMINPTFGVLARGEYRQARVWLGDERLYLTQSWRATLGVRAVLAPGTALKAEYLHNGEFGKGYPAVRNDIFTSSLVLSF